MLIIAGMTAMALAGCQRQDEVTVSEPAPVPVPEPAYVVADLTLALPDISPSPASTRMASEVVQDGSSRDVSILSITPFEKQGTILSTDKASYVDGFSNDQQYVDKDKDNDGNFTRKYHYFEAMSFQRGVASMLTYAKAKPESAPSGATTKSYNGSLMTMVDGEKKFNEVAGEYYIPRFITPGSLTFDLEPIYDIDSKPVDEKIPPHATAIAAYLTTIANSEVPVGDEPSAEKLRWKDTDGVLKGLYNGFINMGNDARPGLIAGSSANVIPFVNALYEDIDETLVSENISLTDIQKELCKKIKENILVGKELPSGEDGFKVVNNKVTSLGLDYPGELGLPDGAAVLLWNTEYTNDPSEQHFGVVTQTTSTSNITGMGRYAYPPELYYYGNSLIQTSNDEVDNDQYDNLNTWEDVLALYHDGTQVSGDTKAVAIKDPLQYGVGRLQARVNPVGSVLPDSYGDNIPVTAESFPITGIIISGQFPVGYDFTVISNNTTTGIQNESGDNSIEHFVYDRHVLNNQGEKIYLSATEQTDEFNTLSLQTKTYSQEKPEESDVTVILEFENKSGQDFRGENKMIVYQNTKFYLVGKLKLTQAGVEDYEKRIFTQDHTTEVTMTINSLARAYNVMPNILSGRLEVSVEMKLKWTEATPTTVILK